MTGRKTTASNQGRPDPNSGHGFHDNSKMTDELGTVESSIEWKSGDEFIADTEESE